MPYNTTAHGPQANAAEHRVSLAKVAYPFAGSPSRIDVEDDDPFGQSRDQLRHGLMRWMRQVAVSGRTACETDDERPPESTLQTLRARARSAMDGQSSRDRLRERARQLGDLVQLRASDFRLPADEDDVHNRWNGHRYRVP